MVLLLHIKSFWLSQKRQSQTCVGENLVLPAAKETIVTATQQNASSVLRAVFRNKDTVKRCIDEKSFNGLEQLIEVLIVT